MRPRGVIIAATATIAIGAAWALARVNRDIDAVFGDVVNVPEGLKVAANRSAGWSKGGRRPSVTNAIQTNQTEQFISQSNSRIKSGQTAK